nr:ATP synthase F0 subunit 8 [Proneotermes latifrons]
MPQMMPLSWMALFIMFSMTLVLFAATNYYVKTPKAKTHIKKTISTKNMNWKW